ncbi:MAG: hypothetical protein HY889_09690 [Deltaproteobacteria bacterium]|nr:hypothetical protein [Deltaproteobacteria bacterium]
MRKLISFTGAAAGSTIGWWLGSYEGFMTAFVLSVLATALGYWAAGRLAKEYLG